MEKGIWIEIELEIEAEWNQNWNWSQSWNWNRNTKRICIGIEIEIKLNLKVEAFIGSRYSQFSSPESSWIPRAPEEENPFSICKNSLIYWISNRDVPPARIIPTLVFSGTSRGGNHIIKAAEWLITMLLISRERSGLEMGSFLMSPAVPKIPTCPKACPGKGFYDFPN